MILERGQERLSLSSESLASRVRGRAAVRDGPAFPSLAKARLQHSLCACICSSGTPNRPKRKGQRPVCAFRACFDHDVARPQKCPEAHRINSKATRLACRFRQVLELERRSRVPSL